MEILSLINNIYFTITFSIAVALYFIVKQRHYYIDTKKNISKFETFFKRENDYKSNTMHSDGGDYPKLVFVGDVDSDLNNLFDEINTYLYKTKGTSDYEFIRNKVERKLDTRYDQATVHLTFPTHIGLMGTFAGVFLGIFMFLVGFDGGNVSDASIRNLLIGVLVSMITSLIGLYLTTTNQGRVGEARKKIEDEKNVFYDFIQTDVTKTASASLVSAISKLHDTVDKFEPAFNDVMNRFQTTFNNCTKAFGDTFEKNVVAVANAVEVMGKNMDKINENIDLQHKLLNTIKSGELESGMEKYVEAANHFASITKSLDMFEEARRMMLAAAQEAIRIQNQYSDSLRIPREVAVRINQILDRITTFEDSVNAVGVKLNQQNILGSDVVNAIGEQVNGIAKKGRIADKYLNIADGKLDNLYDRQSKAIDEMGKRYKNAIDKHINGFEKMLEDYTSELEEKHKRLVEVLQSKFSVDDIRQEFSNLKKLNDIVGQLKSLTEGRVKSDELKNLMQRIESELSEIKTALQSAKATENSSEHSGGFFGGIFGSNSKR